MKNLFFILLAANLGYSLWYFMIEMPRNFDESGSSDLILPEGVETIVLVSEVNNNLGSVAKGKDHDVSGQGKGKVYALEDIAEPSGSLSDEGPMLDRTLVQIAGIQYSLAVDSIVRGFKIAQDFVMDSIVDNLADGMEHGNLAEKFDLPWKTIQENVDSLSSSGSGSNSKHCYELGPFNTIEYANTVASKMDSKVSWHQVRSSWDEVHVGYWVLYLPDRVPKGFGDSKANLAMLKSRGINDTWLFTAGELRGSISLGLFKSEARAIKKSKSLRENGINSVVQPWITEIEHFRLRVKWNDTRRILESWLVPHSSKDQEIQISDIENCERVETNKLGLS